jgi:PTH1 family peptidyl-tRNA hydrolase
MKLLVGLGNPGLWYRNTRHNVGFSVITELSKKCRIPMRKKVCRGILGEGSFKSEDIFLFMPETYMNLSGEAVYQMSRSKGIEAKDILVICDDVNLKLGFLRLREKGSSGGQKGINSVIERLGTDEFPRLRIGIGGESPVPNLTRFVLERFSKNERPIIEKAVEEACRCALLWVKEGPTKAMAVFNKRQTP